jgi:hypothetical protein
MCVRLDLEVGDKMATIGNRQNLTPEEAALSVEFYNSVGRLDAAKTKAANDKIFHSNNVVTTVIAGSIVKNAAATLAKHKTARDQILSDNR